MGWSVRQKTAHKTPAKQRRRIEMLLSKRHDVKKYKSSQLDIGVIIRGKDTILKNPGEAFT